MPPVKNEIGRVYGRLTVLDRAVTSQDRHVSWLCVCECGRTSIVRGCDLRSGHTTNCRSCATATAKTTHGLERHYLYTTWKGVIQRCDNQKHRNYPDYGARGIVVYPPWREGPAGFIEWVEVNLGQRPPGHSIDRIDNDAGYVPGNLRWATQSQQCRNRRPRRLTAAPDREQP
jgi:hypothetical protein